VPQSPKADAPAADIVEQPSPAAQQETIASRFASHRAALGTYTRSKLPSIRLRSSSYGPQAQADRQAESGEVFQDGYRPKPNLGPNLGENLSNYRMPYNYE
jgi:hypothetical protein